MLKRCLTILVLIWGYLLYVPTARACEESPLPYWMDYQAFLSEYRAAIAEGRDTIGDWPLSAAAKVAGPEGTGYAFVWMDEDTVPELLIGNRNCSMCLFVSLKKELLQQELSPQTGWRAGLRLRTRMRRRASCMSTSSRRPSAS